MPPTNFHGTIIVIDIGRNVSDPEEKNEKSFFQQAKECTARIIERKILSQGKNLMGIVWLGSKKTKNNMAIQCPGSFRHIELFADLQAPSWQMIRDLPDAASNSKGDWFEALIVAADHLKTGVSGVKFATKKIILMTNFLAPSNIDSEDFEQVLKGFKEDAFEVDVIGPDIYDENQKVEDIELARQFVETTDGATATFDNTMRYLLFHQKRVKNPMPWNIDLTIGPNIKIPVSAFIRLKDEPIVNNWKTAIKDPVTSTASTTEGVIREKIYTNSENQIKTDRSNVVDSYVYGGEPIPCSNLDKSLFYKSGEKCLSVYGFTHVSNINWHNLNGDGLHYIFGRKGDIKAQYAIRCLVECLHELNLVGVVRKVHYNDCAPKMHVIMPVIDTDDFICLSMAEICFKEEIKSMLFPPTNLKRYECTDEQVNAFKDLITSMDLMKAYDESFDDIEAFPTAETVSPSAQYILDCIAFRALNPGKPLPQPRDDIMVLFKVPSLIEKRAREPLDKLQKLFTLNKVEKKIRNKRKIDEENDSELMKPPAVPNKHSIHDIPKIKLPALKKAAVERLGTMDPISDYKALQNNGKSLSELSPEMTSVIENLIYCNLDGNYNKALNTMAFFRTECVKSDPSHYNNWLRTFRTTLLERKKTDVLDIINEKKQAFIIKQENILSTYEAETSIEDSEFYENDTIPNSTELAIATDINDMFDEM